MCSVKVNAPLHAYSLTYGTALDAEETEQPVNNEWDDWRRALYNKVCQGEVRIQDALYGKAETASTVY